MDEILKIIGEYQAELAEAGSENQRRAAMEYAFNRILEIAKPAEPEKKNRYGSDPFLSVAYSPSDRTDDDVEREEKNSPAIYVRRTGNKEGE